MRSTILASSRCHWLLSLGLIATLSTPALAQRQAGPRQASPRQARPARPVAVKDRPLSAGQPDFLRPPPAANLVPSQAQAAAPSASRQLSGLVAGKPAPALARPPAKKPKLRVSSYDQVEDAVRDDPSLFRRDPTDLVLENLLPGSQVKLYVEQRARPLASPRQPLRPSAVKATRQLTLIKEFVQESGDTAILTGLNPTLPVGARVVAEVRDPFGRQLRTAAIVGNEADPGRVLTPGHVNVVAEPTVEVAKLEAQPLNIFRTNAFLAESQGELRSAIVVRGAPRSVPANPGKQTAAEDLSEVRVVNLQTGQAAVRPASSRGSFEIPISAEQLHPIAVEVRLGAERSWQRVARFDVPLNEGERAENVLYEPVVPRADAPRWIPPHPRARGGIVEVAAATLQKPRLVRDGGSLFQILPIPVADYQQLSPAAMRARLAKIVNRFDLDSRAPLGIIFAANDRILRGSPRSLRVHIKGFSAERLQPLLSALHEDPELLAALAHTAAPSGSEDGYGMDRGGALKTMYRYVGHLFVTIGFPGGSDGPCSVDILRTKYGDAHQRLETLARSATQQQARSRTEFRNTSSGGGARSAGPQQGEARRAAVAATSARSAALQTLGLPEGASSKQVLTKFRALTKKLNPGVTDPAVRAKLGLPQWTEQTAARWHAIAQAHESLQD